MSIKIKTFLFVAFLLQINVAYITAAEEKQFDNFQDTVMNDFKTKFAPLHEGFALLGLDYNAFIESKRNLIPETDSDYSIFMHEIVVAAEDEIIHRMQELLEQGFTVAIQNHTDVDELTMSLFDYAISYELSLGSVILQSLRNLPNLLIEATSQSNIQIIHMLIRAGADIHACDWFGNSILMLACEKGLSSVVKVLIAAKVDIKAFDNNGRSALMLACENGHSDIAQMLITAGADIHINDSRGRSILMLACEKGLSSVVKVLIEAKVDIDALDNNGRSALMFACEKGHIEVVKMLIAVKVDIEALDNNGRSALMFACEKGYVEVVKMLIDAEASTYPLSYDGYMKFNGNTALMEASRGGHVEIAEILLAKGAGVNIRDNDGNTALMWAFRRGHLEIVKKLIAEGADVNIRNNHGRTVLDTAPPELLTIIQQAIAEREAREL